MNNINGEKMKKELKSNSYIFDRFYKCIGSTLLRMCTVKAASYSLVWSYAQTYKCRRIHTHTHSHTHIVH